MGNVVEPEFLEPWRESISAVVRAASIQVPVWVPVVVRFARSSGLRDFAGQHRSAGTSRLIKRAFARPRGRAPAWSCGRVFHQQGAVHIAGQRQRQWQHPVVFAPCAGRTQALLRRAKGSTRSHFLLRAMMGLMPSASAAPVRVPTGFQENTGSAAIVEHLVQVGGKNDLIADLVTGGKEGPLLRPFRWCLLRLGFRRRCPPQHMVATTA